jgi:hypothetical protein
VYNKQTAQMGAVTLIQRFGSAMPKSPVAILNSRRGAGLDGRSNLNIHFHEAHPCASPFGAAVSCVNRLSCRFIICSTLMVYMPKITMAKRVLMMNILVHHPTGNLWLSSLFIWNKQQQLCWRAG